MVSSIIWTLISKDRFVPHPRLNIIPEVWKFPSSNSWYHYALSPGNLRNDFYNELGLFADYPKAQYAISREVCKDGHARSKKDECEPIDVSRGTFSLQFDLRHENNQKCG